MNSPSGRERLGAVDQPDGLHLLERRHAPDRVLEQRLEARPVLLEQLAVEVGGDAVERPRRRIALVAAHDQAARLGPEVDEERRVAHGRHVGRQAARPRDQVLVRHRHDRDVDACERADLAGEHAARVHDDLRLDRAAVGLDARDPAALDADARDPRARLDLGAVPAGALGEGEGQLARVDVAVGGDVRGSEHAVGRHRRKELAGLRGGDELEPEPERLRPARLPGDLLHPLLPTTPAAASRPRASPSPAPPRAPSVRYSSTELIIIFVRLIEPRSWPTRPAEWKVEPLVRSARSTRTASAHPRRASQ